MFCKSQMKYFLVLCLGLLVRYFSFNSSLQELFRNRLEVSAPLGSWKRVTEGVHLQASGVSPYSGDVFHEVPLALWLYYYMFQYIPQYIPWIFMASDLLSAILLAWSTQLYSNQLMRQEQKMKTPASSKHLLISTDNIQIQPFFVLCVYLFCPYTILSCVGQSTTTLTNLILTLSVTTLVTRQWFLCSLFTTVLIYHSLYPLVLVVPLLMAVYHHKRKHRKLKLLLILLSFLLGTSGLLFLSQQLMGDWQFLSSTYGFLLSVPDLTPNIGLFWYFFTEMFEQFRVLFLWTFQINVFIYAIPLAIKFRSEAVLLFYVEIFMMAIFKSYPTLGDYAIPISLLPLWKHTFPFLRQRFLVGCILAITFILAPLLWHLWIYSGSANSNFYFGITLAFNTAQIFLVTDLLFAHCKRDHQLHKGIQLDQEGKPIRLDLK